MLRPLVKEKAVEPIDDFFALEGSLAHKAIKGKTIQEIIKIEEGAWEKEAVGRCLKTLKTKTLLP